MTEGIFALAGVVVGAVLGLATNAAIERWRHSYLRRDARTDRYAATLVEVLDTYTAFVLAWSTPANTIALGGTVDMLDPAIVAGPPGITHRRLTALTERVHIESLRLRLGEFIDTVTTAVGNGTVTFASINAWSEMGVSVAADIGAELRKLEAL